MTTTQDLVNDTKRLLLSGHREEVNRLNGAITNVATNAVFKYDLKGIAEGAVVSIDLEKIRVWEVNTATKTAGVVERGVLGTVAAAHSDLAIVTTNARFDSFDIVREINNDLADLSSPSNGLFKIETVDLVYSSRFQGYDLGAGASDIIGPPVKVLAKSTGPSRYWPEIRKWRYDSNLPTADFANAKAIFLYQAGYQGQTIRVFYPASFTALSISDITVDVATTGLPTTAHDLPPLGAALNLMSGREVKRNFTESQGQPRRATEVPPTAVEQSYAGINKRRNRRIRAEVARLHNEWPMRMTG